MKPTPTPKTDEGATWYRRARLAVAGVALAALAVFGASVATAPDVPEPDETAGATWSYSVAPSPTDGGGKWGPQAFGATWS